MSETLGLGSASWPRLISAGEEVACPKCGYKDATSYTLDPAKPLTCPRCNNEWLLTEPNAANAEDRSLGAAPEAS